jgi:hypothetical protein
MTTGPSLVSLLYSNAELTGGNRQCTCPFEIQEEAGMWSFEGDT